MAASQGGKDHDWGLFDDVPVSTEEISSPTGFGCSPQEFLQTRVANIIMNIMALAQGRGGFR